MKVSLARERRLVELAASGLAGVAAGPEDPGLELVRIRLRETWAALARAGGLSAWKRLWIITLMFLSGVWVTAAVAGDLIGLPSGWVITVAVVTFLALTAVAHRMDNSLAAGRRRKSTGLTGESVPGSAAEIIWVMERARDGIREATRLRLATHRFAPAARTAAGFDWLRGIDPPLFSLSLADRCLCQAIDSLEVWRATQNAPVAARADS